MSTQPDAQAYGGKYISSDTTETGTATWTVSRFRRPATTTSGAASFTGPRRRLLLRHANGGPEDVYDDAEGTWSPQWQWTVLNGRNGTGVPLTLDPADGRAHCGIQHVDVPGPRGGQRGRSHPRHEGSRTSSRPRATSRPSSTRRLRIPSTTSSRRSAATRSRAAAEAATTVPSSGVTRAQMAVFLLKSKYGSTYTPASRHRRRLQRRAPRTTSRRLGSNSSPRRGSRRAVARASTAPT